MLRGDMGGSSIRPTGTSRRWRAIEHLRGAAQDKRRADAVISISGDAAKLGFDPLRG